MHKRTYERCYEVEPKTSVAKVKIMKHQIVLNADIDEKNVATVKIFGTLCKFQEHEYEIVED